MKIEAIPFEELAVGKQADGLIPAIVQDDRTLQVLMLGYMNREAYLQIKYAVCNSPRYTELLLCSKVP